MAESPPTRIIWVNGQPRRVASELAKQVLTHNHECVFCSWHGPFADYYSHWRLNHRRLAGYSRTEIAHA